MSKSNQSTPRQQIIDHVAAIYAENEFRIKTNKNSEDLYPFFEEHIMVLIEEFVGETNSNPMNKYFSHLKNSVPAIKLIYKAIQEAADEIEEKLILEDYGYTVNQEPEASEEIIEDEPVTDQEPEAPEETIEEETVTDQEVSDLPALVPGQDIRYPRRKTNDIEKLVVFSPWEDEEQNLFGIVFSNHSGNASIVQYEDDGNWKFHSIIR